MQAVVARTFFTSTPVVVASSHVSAGTGGSGMSGLALTPEGLAVACAMTSWSCYKDSPQRWSQLQYAVVVVQAGCSRMKSELNLAAAHHCINRPGSRQQQPALNSDVNHCRWKKDVVSRMFARMADGVMAQPTSPAIHTSKPVAVPAHLRAITATALWLACAAAVIHLLKAVCPACRWRGRVV
jgi:hypothetical protein